MERDNASAGDVGVPVPEQDLLRDLGGVLDGVRGVLGEPAQPGPDGVRLTERQRSALRILFQQLPILLAEVERYLYRPCSTVLMARAFGSMLDFDSLSAITLQHLADMSMSVTREVLPLYSTLLQSVVVRSSLQSQDPGWWIKERSTHWFWQMVMGRWIEGEEEDLRWRRIFRMSQSRFVVCLEAVRPHITRQTTNFRRPHPPEIRLVVCFLKLASGTENHILSEQLAIGESTIVDIIHEVVPKFITAYAYQISFPRGEELFPIVQGFQAISGMPNVAGAIDCTHVEISKPAVQDATQWFYKRAMYVVSVQAVCSADRKFLSIYASSPATYHDQQVLRVSSMFNKVMAGQFLSEDGMTLPSMTNFSPYLIGDRGYTPYTWLISPVKANAQRGALTEQEVYFNKRLSEARVRVEHAFGLLKRTFLSMGMKVKMKVEFVPRWILFACILQNILIDSRELLEDDMLDEVEAERARGMQRVAARDNLQRERVRELDALEAAGVAKRQQLIDYMWASR